MNLRFTEEVRIDIFHCYSLTRYVLWWLKVWVFILAFIRVQKSINFFRIKIYQDSFENKFEIYRGHTLESNRWIFNIRWKTWYFQFVSERPRRSQWSYINLINVYNIQFVIFNLRGDLWWYSFVAYKFEHDMQHMFRIKNSCVIIKSLSHDYPLIKYHKTFYTIFPLKIHRFGPSLFRAWPVVYQTKVKGWNRRTLYEPLTMVHIVIYRLYNIVFLSYR